MNQLKVIEKYSALLRWQHWLNVVFLFIMGWSGILIYWADPAYLPVPEKIGPFSIHHRLAEGMGWHFFIMWFFTINGVIYVVAQFVTGDWRQMVPTLSDLKKALPYFLYDLKLRKVSPEWQGRFNPVQKIAYCGAILMGVGSVLSGLAIFKPVQFSWLTALLGGYKAARFEHFILLIGFMLFAFVHVVQVLRAGWNNLRAMIAGFEVETQHE